MTAYYYFYNATIEQSNTLPIPGYGQSTWVSKLDNLDKEKIAEIFKSVITANGWEEDNLILAFPSDGSDAIAYSDGAIICNMVPSGRS